MTLLRTLFARLGLLRRSAAADADLDDELRAFLAARIEAHERRGFAPAAARRAALLEIEGIEQVKERVRDVRIGAALAEAVRDVRYGARALRRSPGYALVVVLTLALGIGVNAAIFSVMHAVLWKALPYPDAGRIVVVEADTQTLPSAYTSSGAVLDVRTQSRLISNIEQAEGRDASLALGDRMERVAAARVTDGLLPLLGAEPMALGRPLTDADADGIVVRGVVISHELWLRLFAGDPGAIGRRLTINNFDVAVVGVTRPGFRLVLPAANHAEERIDVWMPKEFAPGLVYRGLPMIGRLARGTTLAAAQAELDTTAGRFAAANASASSRSLRFTVRRLDDVVTRDVRPALVTLGAAVGFVLLIACVNIASLLLARAKTREQELAVRRALGATRLRLVRQLLTENLIVATLGGAGGLAVAWFAVGMLDWLRPTHLPRQSEIAIDATVVAWTIGLTALASVLFSLVPAIAFTRDSGEPLPASRAGSLMLRSRRLHRGLVLSEIALSIVPLIAAGLLLRSFVNLLQAPLGFEPAHVVTARVSLDLHRFNTIDGRSAFYREASARLRELPGIEAASIGGPLPLAPIQTTQRVSRGDEPGAAPAISLQQSVMPGYLDVMGIALRAGRDVSADDIAHRRRVVVIDERLAAQLWNGDALGKRLAIGESKEPLEVIGVAGHVRSRAIRDAGSSTIYVPSHVYEIEQTLVVRTREPLAAIGPAITRTVEALGPGRPVFDVRSMETVVAASIDNTRFTMLVLAGFAISSLGLAGIGLYGTLAYLTSQRRQEFGVRLALGASPTGIVRLVVREGCQLAGAGAALGLVGAVTVSRGLQGLLYGVTPLDAWTIAGVAGLVAAVALVAIGGPAWRAAQVDPVATLRAE